MWLRVSRGGFAGVAPLRTKLNRRSHTHSYPIPAGRLFHATPQAMTKEYKAAEVYEGELPIVDLALQHGTDAERAEFTRNLDRGLFEIGFFLLKYAFFGPCKMRFGVIG